MINELIEENIQKMTFPGLVLFIEINGKKVIEKCAGLTSLEEGLTMSSDTLFDLASLTKPLATTPTLLALLEGESLGFDRKVSYFLKDVNDRMGDLTLSQLMTHTSGLPPVPEIFKLFRSEDEINEDKALDHLYSLKPEINPGTEVIYSCTGYILITQILRKIAGCSLSAAFRKLIIEPSGIDDLLFTPGPEDKERCVSTEYCSWRKRMLRGEVHDENSWCLGGEGGNAGLFGTAEAVAALSDIFLHEGVLRGKQLLKPEHAAFMTTPRNCPIQPPRAFGFLTQCDESFAGPGFSSKAFGHTGFTGTSLWIDPVQKLKVVAFTNRVHYGRENTAEKIKRFRLDLHQAILKGDF